MALLESQYLRSLDFIHGGMPFVNIEASTVSDTKNIDTVYYTNLGPFFGGTGGVSQVITNNVYVKRSDGSWAQCVEIHVNINGSWKRAVNDVFYIRTASSWRS